MGFFILGKNLKIRKAGVKWFQKFPEKFGKFEFYRYIFYMRKCNKCGIEKDFTEFHKRIDGQLRQCKSCETEYQREYRKKLRKINDEDRSEKVNKKTEELINKYVGLTFGSFKITSYLGYYTTGNAKHNRHMFQKECIFCGNKTYNPTGQINSLMRKEGICCNLCKGSINIHTKEKKCSDCQVWFPATNEYFPLSKNRPFGIHYYCKKCHHRRGVKHRENPENRKREYKQKEARMLIDPLFKLSCRIRVQIKNYIKRVNVDNPKPCKTTNILQCSFYDFKEHLEKQFDNEMSWDNYGKWHLEHIIPVSYGETPEEVIELCHYSNYQPMWGDENLNKNNKLRIDEIPEELKIRYKKYIDRYIDNPKYVRYSS